MIANSAGSTETGTGTVASGATVSNCPLLIALLKALKEAVPSNASVVLLNRSKSATV